LEEIDPEHPHQRKSKDDDGSILPGLLLTAGIIAAIGGVAYWFLKKRRQNSTFDSRAYSGLGIN
jgi:LPXTG-motif cell wall-anchored protein